MKKVRYIGELPVILPTVGLEVNPEDVIDVPDDFNNAAFEEITEKKTIKGDN
jgi:hypothetical protein